MSNKILVIDDNKFILDLVSYILDNNGYQVEVFNKAEGVLDHIETSHPRLVILDVGLPDADGRDLCRQIKQSAKSNNIPVVMCSGRSDVRECLNQQGAPDAILAKPFDINQLMQVVMEKLSAAA
ncbi:response regulator [Mucilaginibacter robiniae]|uniref:Response regulator n=1 Tax=Mucilaginibacter robiniae TaxID=2728022 RepID=A0A7L5DX60_9SPHI|nr:response regulator [Mucilaginibacter robiniae]QJD94687.1 response regulator [Mucilaginibacter robiniae]